MKTYQYLEDVLGEGIGFENFGNGNGQRIGFMELRNTFEKYVKVRRIIVGYPYMEIPAEKLLEKGFPKEFLSEIELKNGKYKILDADSLLASKLGKINDSLEQLPKPDRSFDEQKEAIKKNYFGERYESLSSLIKIAGEALALDEIDTVKFVKDYFASETIRGVFFGSCSPFIKQRLFDSDKIMKRTTLVEARIRRNRKISYKHRFVGKFDDDFVDLSEISNRLMLTDNEKKFIAKYYPEQQRSGKCNEGKLVKVKYKELDDFFGKYTLALEAVKEQLRR